MRHFFACSLAALAVLLAPAAQANNLQVQVSTYATVPGTADQLYLTVNLGWEHSWRDSENWDAAWVFVKYLDRSTPGAEWRTATLATADADHLVTPSFVLNAAADGKGAFVYRATPGNGIVNGLVTLRWNGAADGVQFNAMSHFDVRVLGVEMVHIPEGPFNLNALESGPLTNEFVSVQGSLSSVTSEGALPAGAIRWVNDTGTGGTGHELSVGSVSYPGSAALPPTYPKGYAAMYCMKYETTQGQYTDFLNTLTRAQQQRRVAVDISADAPAGGKTYVTADATTAAQAFRNTIQCPAFGMGTIDPVVFFCDRPDRAHNFAIWADCAAYLDWAGLRPLSELEYEKIARGPLPVVANELAGGTSATTAALTISGPEDGTETTDAGAAYAYGFQNFVGGDAGNGPLRAGIFATAATTRAQAGAGYYGVLELSGNVWERCVTVADSDAFLPTNAAAFSSLVHGDGLLDAQGNHDVGTWPNSTDVRGSNFRGGNWSRPAEWAAVSDRQYGGSAVAGRTSHRGIRGGRSASSLSGPAHGTNGTTFDAAKYTGGSYDGYSVGAVTVIVVGLRDEAAARAATAAPNPTATATVLRLDEATPALLDGTLTLTDALGRPVRTISHLSGEAVRVERGAVAPGVYFYQLTDAGRGRVATGRVVFE